MGMGMGRRREDDMNKRLYIYHITYTFIVLPTTNHLLLHPSMATFAKSLPLFFLLTLLLSLQTLARDSQFFSKFTRDSNEITNTNTNTFYKNNNLQGTQVKVQAKEEEPAFLPQTTQNAAYGLYGRETDVFSPSTTKYNQPQYKPEKEEPLYYNNNNKNYYNGNNHGKNYATELQGLDGYTKENGNNYYYNGEKQGMSDTRFLEKGRYFYDARSEKANNLPNNYGYQGGNGKPEYYNNNGYYSGSTENFNSYYKNNYRGDQSLEEEEEAFDFDP